MKKYKNPEKWYTFIGLPVPNAPGFSMTQIEEVINISKIPSGIPLWRSKQKAIKAANFLMTNPNKQLPIELKEDLIS